MSRQFAEIAVAAGDAFPDAFSQLQPYMMPLEGYSSMYAIEKTQAPDVYPTETLALLWGLLGPDSRAEVFDAAKLLDRLIAADPELERDRRLQWLDQKYRRDE